MREKKKNLWRGQNFNVGFGEAIPSDMRFIASFWIPKHRDTLAWLSRVKAFPQILLLKYYQ